MQSEETEDYTWLTDGYLRECDWIADQEDHITVTNDFNIVDVSLVEEPLFEDAKLPKTRWGKFATRLNLLNDRCQRLDTPNPDVHSEECMCSNCMQSDLEYFQKKLARGLRAPSAMVDSKRQGQVELDAIEEKSKRLTLDELKNSERLANETMKLLTKIQNEDAYNEAMGIVKNGD